MRLQRQISRMVQGTEYVKWVVVIPPSQIKELGWREGMELQSRVKGNKLIIKPLINKPNKPKKMTYTEFRDKIAELLKSEPKGLTWTEIKRRLNLPQKVPNNLWVRMMEKDIGLIREKRGIKTIWRLG